MGVGNQEHRRQEEGSPGSRWEGRKERMEGWEGEKEGGKKGKVNWENMKGKAPRCKNRNSHCEPARAARFGFQHTNPATCSNRLTKRRERAVRAS